MRNMKTNDDLSTVRIRRDLKIATDEWLKTDYAQSLGFSSISNFITLSVREALMKYRGPTFTDLVRYETHYELFDVITKNKINIIINRSENGLECERCDSFKCDHVLFIWNSVIEKTHLRQMKFPNPFIYLTV